MSITLLRFTAYSYHLDSNVQEVWINPLSVSRVVPRIVGADHRQREEGTRIFIGENASVDVGEDLSIVVAALAGRIDEWDDRESIQPAAYYHSYNPR